MNLFLPQFIEAYSLDWKIKWLSNLIDSAEIYWWPLFLVACVTGYFRRIRDLGRSWKYGLIFLVPIPLPIFIAPYFGRYNEPIFALFFVVLVLLALSRMTLPTKTIS